MPNGTQQACRDSRMPHGQAQSGRSDAGCKWWSFGVRGRVVTLRGHDSGMMPLICMNLCVILVNMD